MTAKRKRRQCQMSRGVAHVLGIISRGETLSKRLGVYQRNDVGD